MRRMNGVSNAHKRQQDNVFNDTCTGVIVHHRVGMNGKRMSDLTRSIWPNWACFGACFICIDSIYVTAQI